MSAIAIDFPDDVVAARDGIVAFAEQEVIPRHQQNHELFDNPDRQRGRRHQRDSESHHRATPAERGDLDL